MQASLTHSERVAVARLQALLDLLPTALDKRLGAAGITAFEYTLLEALHDAPQYRMRLSALAVKTNASLPRISRVASSLERRDLIERAPCAEDGRATNAVLTERGAETHRASRALYASAVRDLVLDGLASLPDDGVGQLADVALAVLTSLDPMRRGGLGAASPAEEAPAAPPCSADPSATEEPECSADPSATEEPECSADPSATEATDCSADPARATIA